MVEVDNSAAPDAPLPGAMVNVAEQNPPAVPAVDPAAVAPPLTPRPEPASSDPEIDEPAETEDPDLDAIKAEFDKHCAAAVEDSLSWLRRVGRLDLTGDHVATAIGQALAAERKAVDIFRA